MNLISKINPFCVGFEAGGRFLDRYTKSGDITEDVNKHQQLSKRAEEDMQRYISKIAKIRGYGTIGYGLFRFGFFMGSD